MRIFFDSSVLVAALWGGHPNHAICAEALDRASAGANSCFTSHHALAEVYSSLTGKVSNPRIPSEEAALAIKSLLEVLTVASLDEHDYVKVLEVAVALSARGGSVYDLIHIQAARKCKAEVLMTLDFEDYSRLSVEEEFAVQYP